MLNEILNETRQGNLPPNVLGGAITTGTAGVDGQTNGA